jgi:tetratricopeptide (TPR) repeat protein
MIAHSSITMARLQISFLQLLFAILFGFASMSMAASDHPPQKAAPAAPVEEAADTNSASPASQLDALLSTNLVHLETRPKAAPSPKDYRHQIDTARQLRRNKDSASAARMLITLLEEELPAEFKKAALFELGLVAQDEKRLSRAQQILAQYIQLFPQDPTVPEVLLRQGLIYRQMGAYQMAITKFYSVMNTALGLKLEQFDYYKRLVLQAQTEIADTYYVQGKFAEAADFFGRILKQNALELNRPQVHFKYVRCLSNLGRHDDTVRQCETFFEKHPTASEVPELRFVAASALKQLGRSRDALAQVLKLLESQAGTERSNPENWVYWQQRAGNDIANQLYSEGDYLGALELYTHLAGLNKALEWQLPVWYQMGLIYERLNQQQKAVETYTSIAGREKELTGSADTPSLKTVIEMAKWRKDQIGWRGRAEVAVRELHLSPPPPSSGRAAVTQNP